MIEVTPYEATCLVNRATVVRRDGARGRRQGRGGAGEGPELGRRALGGFVIVRIPPCAVISGHSFFAPDNSP